jgi:hypothetical protein
VNHGSVFYGKLQQNGKPVSCPVLVFTGTADGNIIVPFSPVFRQACAETVDSFGNDYKMQIAPQPYHVPGLRPPLIRFFQEKIRCHTGINTFPVRFQFIFAPSAAFYGQGKICRLCYDAAVPAEFSISPVNITISAARADLFTAMPWIPNCHPVTSQPDKL